VKVFYSSKSEAVRGEAVGYIDWLDGGGISSRAVVLKVQFSVRDFNMCDVSRIKLHIGMTANFGDDRMVRDRNILDDATISQRDGDDLVVHARLGLTEEEFAPMFRQRGHII